MLELIIEAIIFQSKLYFCIFRPILKIDEKVSSIFIDSVLDSKNVAFVYHFQSFIGSFEILNVLEATFAAYPVIDFYL
jgi:hypothetical protein